jgi:hypothetical protein
MAKHLCEAPLVVVKAAALWLIYATNVNHHVAVVQHGWVTAAHDATVCAKVAQQALGLTVL